MLNLKTITDSKPYFKYVKKHYCPHCDVKLMRKKEMNFIDKHSTQAREYNKGFIYGVHDIKNVDTVFECQQCKRVYHMNDLKKHERQLKHQYQN